MPNERMAQVSTAMAETIARASGVFRSESGAAEEREQLTDRLSIRDRFLILLLGVRIILVDRR